MKSQRPTTILALLLCVIFLAPIAVVAQESLGQQLVGTWNINEELSEDSDEAVEEAIKSAGGRVSRNLFGRNKKERYRGGPAEQEMYDRITYDDVLRISFDGAEFWFGYEDGFERVFHTDGRTRSVGASELYSAGAQDFSFGEWVDGQLVVEGRPRDDGFTIETYSLIEQGARLKVELLIRPKNFGASIELTRIFDRQ